MLRKGLFIFLLCCYFIQVTGQKTFIHTDEYKSYKYAQELYDKQKYSAAQAYFKEIINGLQIAETQLKMHQDTLNLLTISRNTLANKLREKLKSKE